mgnify:CR=1 FL=1
MTKPIIAIDIDDVLADYAVGFIEFSNAHWDTNLTIDDYDEHWANVWKVDVEEVRRRADLIHEKRLVKDLTHRSEARPILEKLSQRFDLAVVTSRRIQNKEDTLAWLGLYYPMLSVESVTFSGFYDTIHDDSIHQTKGSIISSIGASYMIDDQPKHCISAAECGVEALLFGSYRWNQLANLPPKVTRVRDWDSVEAYFGGR